MTIIERIEEQPSGARFFRADLHIHSFGGSHDVKDSLMTPQEIVNVALAEDFGLIAITDHNEIVNVAAAIKAAQGKPILLVPGVELSTPEGHLLVYFSSVEELEHYYGKLDFADRGNPNSRCQTSLLECLRKINVARGFAILAHVDGDGGLEKKLSGYPPYKGDIIGHPALLGIELRSAASSISYSDKDPVSQRAQFGRKRVEALGLGARQFLARVLFSDSHSRAALGKNATGKDHLTRIKMDAPSFEGLRIALQDADARIRLEDEIPSKVPCVLGTTIEGGFLDAQTIHFSKNLNCIIGGRGTGKSTFLEIVRCLTDASAQSKLVDSEVWPETFHIV
ncbi:MAG: PHP domain-containing protein, partial [Blastocatellia bacterium]